MANRRLNQFRYSFDHSDVEMFLAIDFAADGVASFVVKNNKGLSSITGPTASGAYTLALKDKFFRVMSSDVVFKASGAPAAPEMSIAADNSTTKTLDVVFYAPDGLTATCPGDGEQALIHLVLKNATN